MDFATNTEERCAELKTNQENILLVIIKEICHAIDSKLSADLRGKINRIVADCNLTHYSSLHKVSTADESTSTILGFMQQTTKELTFDEQTELNQAILHKISQKMPVCISELDHLKVSIEKCKNFREEQMKELKERDNKLDLLQEQESEKMELMMEWLNYRFTSVAGFSNNSSELLVLKSKILDLKSKILYLQILQNIFTETNQSIKAYSEIHKDLKDNIKETENRIKHFREIIESDL